MPLYSDATCSRVAVEHERGAALLVERQADAAFGLLAPARVIDIGIHIGVEAVLAGVPC